MKLSCPRLTPFLIQTLSIAASVFCVVFSVFSFVDFNPARLAVNIYILVSGLFLIVVDFKAFPVFGYVKFVYSPTGRGVFFIVIGTLMLLNGVFNIVGGVVMIVVGILYFVFAKMYGGVPKPLFQRNLDELPLSTDLRFVETSGASSGGMGSRTIGNPSM